MMLHPILYPKKSSPSPSRWDTVIVNRSKIAGMRLRAAVNLLGLSLLFVAPCLRAETGAEGWLRYAPLPLQVAQEYGTLPLCIITTSQSPVAQSAASELARGVHSMLGRNLKTSSTICGEDSFVLGT